MLREWKDELLDERDQLLTIIKELQGPEIVNGEKKEVDYTPIRTRRSWKATQARLERKFVKIAKENKEKQLDDTRTESTTN